MSLILTEGSSIWPTAGQTVFFDWFSIVFLAMVVIAMIIGIWKGFLASLLSLVSVVGSILIAFFACQPLANLLAGTGMAESMITSIDGWLCGNETVGPIFQMVLNKADATVQLEAALGEAGVPSALIPSLLDQIIPLIPEVTMDVRLGLYAAEGITKISLIAISFLGIFIVCAIVFAILKIFARKLNKAKGIGWINRLLGGLFGICSGCLVVCLVCYAMTFFTGIPAANDFFVQQLRLDDPTMWSIGKMLYENNFISVLLEKYIKPAIESSTALLPLLPRI